MKAMILAGGMSTRLYPLTKRVPKPLVPVVGVPNAVHVIHYLKAHGIDEIAINVHYLADAIVAALGDGSQFGVRLEYLHERELMGSAGAVKQMQSFFDDGLFVVVGCDDLTDLPLESMLAFHRERKALATIGLVTRERVEHYGVVVTDSNGRISGFQEKPAAGTEQSKLVNTGIYAFEPAILDYIPANEFYDFGKQVFPALRDAHAAFYGFDARDAYWCDIGTPDEYRRATFDVVNGHFSIPHTRGNGIDPMALIAPDASVQGAVWIGPNAVVGTGASIIGPSVIGPGVRIGPHALIEGSIIWDNATIGEHAHLRNAIVGIDYTVAPNEHLDAKIVAPE